MIINILFPKISTYYTATKCVHVKIVPSFTQCLWNLEPILLILAQNNLGKPALLCVNNYLSAPYYPWLHTNGGCSRYPRKYTVIVGHTALNYVECSIRVKLCLRPIPLRLPITIAYDV